MATTEQKTKSSDASKELVIEQRTNAIIITEILLRPAQIKPFKDRLEALRKEFMKND